VFRLAPSRLHGKSGSHIINENQLLKMICDGLEREMAICEHSPVEEMFERWIFGANNSNAGAGSLQTLQATATQ
jgi:hypothetical protein